MTRAPDVGEDPALSIILVPDTYRPSFPAGLEAFLRQAVEPRRFELVVVDWRDGPSYQPLTEKYRAHPGASRVTYQRCAQRGRAAMNNLGVELARAPIVCFCADDFVPGSSFVAAHLDHHAQNPEPTCVGVGPAVAPEAMRRASPFLAWLEDSGELFGARFRDRAAALPAGFFYVANASLKRSLIAVAGRFDERLPFPACDDLDYGQRLQGLGMISQLLPEAVCVHDHLVTLPDRRAQVEWAGRAAVILSSPTATPWHERARYERARAVVRIHLAALRGWGQHARREGPRVAFWRLALMSAYLAGYWRELRAQGAV